MPRAAKKPPRSPRRSGAVLVLLTPEERERCRTHAMAATGLGLGPWLRMIALREATRA